MPRRGMGVEILQREKERQLHFVMPREGHGSRNRTIAIPENITFRHAPRGAWE